MWHVQPFVVREGDVLRVTLPAARNRWFIVLGACFGLPWLAFVVSAAIVGARKVPDERAGLVWLVVALLVLALTGLLDVLALASIWLAWYALAGVESIEMRANGATLRRAAWKIGFRWRFSRGPLDRVARLDPKGAPGRVPHPAIELVPGRSRARIGAGLDEARADRLVAELTTFIAERDAGTATTAEQAVPTP